MIYEKEGFFDERIAFRRAVQVILPGLSGVSPRIPGREVPFLKVNGVGRVPITALGK